MELLLNLAWLLLAVPACWLWQRQFARGQKPAFSVLQCLLALGCALILLFPVISATDDLHAMRAEIEESPMNKRTVRVAASDKNSTSTNRLQSPPVTSTGAVWLPAPEAGRLEVSVASLATRSAPDGLRAGRAPPSSFLG